MYFWCPFNPVPCYSPVFGFQILIVLSILPEASLWQSGLNLTNCTQWVWPVRVYRGVCVKISQTHTVLSPDPEAIYFPSGEKVTHSTASEWPSKFAEAQVIGLTLKLASGL